MNKSKYKALKIVVGVVIALVLLAVLIYVPLSSYIPYRQRMDTALEAARQNDRETLKSISATLNDDVELFENGKATVTEEDFTVTAKYGGKYVQAEYVTVSPEDYTLTIPSSFAQKGGSVIINYRGISTEVEVPLTPLVLTEITLEEQPYLIAYAAGSVFSTEGMQVSAHFNDGSSRIISSGFTADTDPLTTGQKEVTVSYTEKDVTKTMQVPVTVTDTLDNGAITKIEALGDYSVLQGEKLEDVRVLATYGKTGNRRILESDEYRLSQPSSPVALGEKYPVKIWLESDPSIQQEIPVRMRGIAEGEDATGVGYSVSRDIIEYVLEDGVYKDSGNLVGFAALQGRVAVTGGETSVTFTVDVAESGTFNLSVRANNSYVVGSGNNVSANELYLSHIMDIIVDGNAAVPAAEDAIMPAMPTGTQDQIFNTYLTVQVGTFELSAGQHTIKISLHSSEFGETTMYNEPPCSMNIDRIELSSYGVVDPSDCVHKLTKHDAVAPTCEENGTITYYTCEICLASFSDPFGIEVITDVSVPALGHDWGEWVAEDDVYHTRTCTREGCGKTEQAEHEFEYSEVNGEIIGTCVQCGHVVTATAHEITSLKIETPPAKTEYMAGENLDLTGLVVQPYCECGKPLGEPLTVDQLTENGYSLSVANGAALSLGQNVTITYTDESGAQISVALPIRISQTFEVESAKLTGVGNSTGTLTEYYTFNPETNEFATVSESITYLNEVFKVKKSAYDPAVEKSMEYTVTVAEDGYANIILHATNMMWMGTNTAYTGGKWDAAQYNFGDYYDLYINGVLMPITDSAIMPAVITGEDFDSQDKDTPAWTRTRQTFFYITIPHVKLSAGENLIKFRLAYKDGAPLNTFGEFGSEMFDGIRVETYGAQSGHELVYVPAVAPTCVAAGNTEYYKCSVCSAVMDKEGNIIDPAIAPLGHIWSEWQTDETYHWRTCQRPGCVAVERYEHTFDITEYNDEGHWYSCICGETTEIQPHEFNIVATLKKSGYDLGYIFTNDDFAIYSRCECGCETEVTEFTIVGDNDGVTIDSRFVTVKVGETEYEISFSTIIQAEDSEHVSYVGLGEDPFVDDLAIYSKNEDGKCGVVTGETATVLNSGFKTKVADWEKGVDKSLTFTVTAAQAGKFGLTLRIANGNWSDVNYHMMAFSLSNNFDLYINGTKVSFAADAVIEGCNGNIGTNADNTMTDCFQTFYLIHLADVDLVEGENTITLKLSLKADGDEGYVAEYPNAFAWSEFADIKIDYLAIERIDG